MRKKDVIKVRRSDAEISVDCGFLYSDYSEFLSVVGVLVFLGLVTKSEFEFLKLAKRAALGTEYER